MSLIQHLRERLSTQQAYKRLFRTPDGEIVLQDILRRAGVTTPVFDANPEKARLLEGHRHLAFSIYRQVHSSDAPLLKLISEEAQRQHHNVNSPE